MVLLPFRSGANLSLVRILSIAAKESYARERQAALENAGYAVTSALNFKEIKEACAHQRFDLAIVGAYFDPKMKRAIGLTLRDIMPNTPILEMCRGEQEIPEAQYTTSAEVEDMLRMVKLVLPLRRRHKA